MHKFATSFEAVPAPELTVPARAIVKTPGKATVKAKNLSVPGHEGSGVNTGVQIEVYLDAKDLDDALSTAGIIADDFLSELSVCGAAKCGDVEPRIVVDVHPTETIHPFRQYIPVLSGFSRRRVNPRHMQMLRRNIRDMEPHIRQSIWRGMTAYRQAMATIDPVVEFLFLWLAVESMNEPLGRRRRLKKIKPLEGTKATFDMCMPDGLRLYKEAYKLRNKIVHGDRDILEIMKKADELTAPMRIVARNAVASSVNMHWTGDLRPLKSYPVYYMIEFELSAPVGTPLGIKGELPYIKLGKQEITDLVREGKQIKSSHRIKIEERFGPGVVRGTKAKIRVFGEQYDSGTITFEAD